MSQDDTPDHAAPGFATNMAFDPMAASPASTAALPASPYKVMAGMVIAGALVTGIKSDLPGDVITTVMESVYDTTTGRLLLIRILGK
ncbi:TrbI/VirB10 family protein [Kosakonia sp. S42]|uniref:TrbI/VirB10 family protein n=1 Tax=Kosakonia sp. S42 TaxID=2767458 RepID=UPI00190D618B|nr:TrbI/VirB10 family protein [Kosakonia sp. S42]MBK0018738.1 hypothetical protein [Kosakonia sp. S42]